MRPHPVQRAGQQVLTYAVDNLLALEGTILPFFERHPLIVKAGDFAAFAPRS